MTIRSQVDYTHWRCPDCYEVISTLARRSTLPCPRCRSEMVPVDGSPEALARRVTPNGHGKARG